MDERNRGMANAGLSVAAGAAPRRRMAPRAGQRGFGIAGLAIFLIVVIVAGIAIYQLTRPPESRYRAARPEFSTPAGTFNYFNAERAKYQNRTDPVDNLLACMTADDARFFRVGKRPISMDSEFGVVVGLGSSGEQQLMAFQVLTRDLPKPEETEVATVHEQGDKAVLFWKDRAGRRTGSVPMVKEGDNWKIMHWFWWRFSFKSSSWYSMIESMEDQELLPDEETWATNPYSQASVYLKSMQDFYASAGAPFPADPIPQLDRGDMEEFFGEDEPIRQPAQAPAPSTQDANPQAAAREAFVNYVAAANQYLANPANVDSMLAHFSQDDRAWFDRYFKEISYLSEAAAQDEAGMRLAAMSAMLQLGPKTADIHEVKSDSTRALIKTPVTVDGRQTELAVCMVREGDGWKIATFFFTRQMYWMPRIIQTRQQYGQPLTSEELDFQQNGQSRFEAQMREFYGAVGEPAP